MHLRNVHFQAKRRQCRMAFFPGCIPKTVPMLLVERLGQLPDVVSLVAVLWARYGILP